MRRTLCLFLFIAFAGFVSVPVAGAQSILCVAGNCHDSPNCNMCRSLGEGQYECLYFTDSAGCGCGFSEDGYCYEVGWCEYHQHNENPFCCEKGDCNPSVMNLAPGTVLGRTCSTANSPTGPTRTRPAAVRVARGRATIIVVGE